LKTAELVKELDFDRQVYRVELSPDESTMALSLSKTFGAFDAEVVLVETLTGKVLRTFERVGSMCPQLKWSPDGSTLIGVAREGSGYLWDARTGRIRAKLSPGSTIGFMSYSSDGSRIVSSGRDGVITIWHGRSGERLLSLPYEYSSQLVLVPNQYPSDRVAFTSDDKTIYAFCLDRKIRIWNAAPFAVQPKARTKNSL
jgi:WD40 repeat protein